MDKELFKQLDTITETVTSIENKTQLIIAKLDELIAALHEYDNDTDLDWEHDDEFDIGGSE
jgi:hypothetical protein